MADWVSLVRKHSVHRVLARCALDKAVLASIAEAQTLLLCFARFPLSIFGKISTLCNGQVVGRCSSTGPNKTVVWFERQARKL